MPATPPGLTNGRGRASVPGVRVVAALLIAAAGLTAAVLAMRDPQPAPLAAAPREHAAEAAPTPAPTVTARARARRPPPIRVPRCAVGIPSCAAVRGRVVYVERVDPDGDGDLHVVVIGGDVTAPGATAIDVAEALRPRRDPRVGDVVAAAGPVQTGHLGQSQIHALEFRTRRTAR
jgi:hypothetical protein